MNIGDLFTSPDWGTLPDWLAAFGTISAVAWALHLGRRDGKRLDEERRDAKRDREEAAHDRELFRQQQAAEAEAQKRRLASKVSLVVEAFRDEEGRKLRWKVHNGSDEPIAMVSVIRRAVPADDTSGETRTQICKTWTSREAGGNRADVTRVHDESYMAQGEVQFTDSAGQRWQRLEFGALRTLAAEDPAALGFVPIQR